MKIIDVAVIGGGASGFFGAISVKNHKQDSDVIIFEKSQKLLSKVRISGGGRCNITHHCESTSQLLKNYPRGAAFLSKVFKQFAHNDTRLWFETRGVTLKTEDDNRIFPFSDSSESVIECFMNEASKLGITIKLGHGLEKVDLLNNGQFSLMFENGFTCLTKTILVAIGGFNQAKGYQFLTNLGHTIQHPKPSLFTFNIADKQLHTLMGVVSPMAQVKIIGLSQEAAGPVLITHWGLSGPAILKLSAWAATELYEKQYNFLVKINWVNINEVEVRHQIASYILSHPKKLIQGNPLFSVPSRLWEYLCAKSEIDTNLRWQDISKRANNKLVDALTNSQYEVKGKTTFKEEFVTCGGVDLTQVNPVSCESNLIKGLFFAGEVLDIDGITGGFNFQNAWSTSWVAGKNIAKTLFEN